MILQEDMNKWLTLYRRPMLKATSYDVLFRTAKNYVYPYIGTMETNSISTDDVMELIIELSYNRNLSKSTIKKVKELLNCFYRYAVKKHIVVENIITPIMNQKYKKEKRKPPRSMTIEEIKRFVSAALEKTSSGNYRYYFGPAMLIYLHTGLRLGELIGCSPDDYNPDTGELKIHGNVESITSCDDKGIPTKGVTYIYQNTPKTEDSERTIKLNLTAQRYLYPYYLRAKRANSKFLLMSPKSNKCASISTMQTTYTKVTANACINEPHGIHTLRHTCATHLLRNGNDIKVVSAILGHASVKITYDTYIHLFEQDVPDALLSLDDTFRIAG